MDNNLLVITYYLTKYSEDNSEDNSEDEISSEESLPIELNWKLKNSVKEYVKGDIKNIVEDNEPFSDELGPHQLMILHSLQSMHSIFIENTYYILISSISIPKIVTQNFVENRFEGIFAGWYDYVSEPLEIDGHKYKVCPSVSLTESL
jgi:hypothetical protein